MNTNKAYGYRGYTIVVTKSAGCRYQVWITKNCHTEGIKSKSSAATVKAAVAIGAWEIDRLNARAN